MNLSRSAAREISYAASARSRTGRALIRSVENLTGRIGLIRRADGYRDELEAGRVFWDVMAERYGVTLELVSGSLDDIPRRGPLVAVANHPYGILDGLMLGGILARSRGDFRILAHRVFGAAEELDRVILPVSFDETRESTDLNISTRKSALAHLSEGGCVGVFPGGTVSTALTPFGRPMDPRWRRFTARLIAKSGAAVVPIHFDGGNSRLFQIVSHVHPTLRMALLIREFRNKVGGPVRVSIGLPLPEAEIRARAGDAKAMMDYLRTETYRLSPEGITEPALGFEFEDSHAEPCRSEYSTAASAG
jgi:putative hemolysin